jgi:hypothetical protein
MHAVSLSGCISAIQEEEINNFLAVAYFTAPLGLNANDR